MIIWINFEIFQSWVAFIVSHKLGEFFSNIWSVLYDTKNLFRILSAPVGAYKMKATFKTINFSFYHQLKTVTGFYWFVSASNTINLILICQSRSLSVSHTNSGQSEHRNWWWSSSFLINSQQTFWKFPKRLLHLKTRKIRLTNIFLLLALSLMASWNFLLSSTSSTSHTGAMEHSQDHGGNICQK